jgi:chaperonin GroES
MAFKLREFHPLYDRVLIEPVTRDQLYSRIIQPETAHRDEIVPAEGVIRAIGPGETPRFDPEKHRYLMLSNEYRIEMTVNVGDRVLYWPTKTRAAEFQTSEDKWKDCHVMYEEQAIEAILSDDYGVLPRVLGDRVLVDPREPPRSVGRIIVPDGSREKVSRGTVLAVGPGKRSDKTHRRRPIDVKVGDTILIEKLNSECAFLAGGRVYRTIREHEITAVLN